MSIFFFFFQAEDGIRYYKVTGVQTCALPISPPARDELIAHGRLPVHRRERARQVRPVERRRGAQLAFERAALFGEGHALEVGEERADGRVVRRELGELAKRLRRTVGDRPAALGDRARLRPARELTQRAHGDLGANAPFIGPPW